MKQTKSRSKYESHPRHNKSFRTYRTVIATRHNCAQERLTIAIEAVAAVHLFRSDRKQQPHHQLISSCSGNFSPVDFFPYRLLSRSLGASARGRFRSLCLCVFRAAASLSRPRSLGRSKKERRNACIGIRRSRDTLGAALAASLLRPLARSCRFAPERSAAQPYFDLVCRQFDSSLCRRCASVGCVAFSNARSAL